MIRMIAAVSENGVIGVDNDLPWAKDKWPDDMRFFRTMTKDSIVIMGRKTYESMGSKPLPKRENRVISSTGSMIDLTANSQIDLATKTLLFRFRSLEAALAEPNPTNRDIWLIGGEGIYSNGLEYADEIYLTLVPERVETAGYTVARFPFIHPLEWQCEPRMMGELVPGAGEQKLVVVVYKRSKTSWKD